MLRCSLNIRLLHLVQFKIRLDSLSYFLEFLNCSRKVFSCLFKSLSSHILVEFTNKLINIIVALRAVPHLSKKLFYSRLVILSRLIYRGYAVAEICV